MLDIVIHPNKILRNKSINIDIKNLGSKKFKELYLDMERIMLEKDGVGLAAPQVGKNIRLCVINTKQGILKMVNPLIIKKSWAKEWSEEGCLSIPNIFGKVRRHKKITCRFYDENKKIINLTVDSLMARVIQHEIDHLDGILFVDKAKDVIKTEPLKNNAKQ